MGRAPHPALTRAHLSLIFRLETFGGLAIAGDAGTVSTQRRRLALLALIAAAGRRGVSRDRVLACLWPESSTANARHALEQLLYALRRQFGVSLFLGVDPLRLNQQVITSDVTEFDEAVERGDVAKAVSLYRGPFLDGFYLGGDGEFERWVETERARLVQRYASALEQLARQANEAGDRHAAIEHWRKLVALDPVRSHATLGLMNALAAANESTEAIRHGRAYEALARTEGAEPTPAISALLRRLLTEHPEHVQPTAAARTLDIAHDPAASLPSRPGWRVRVSHRALAASVTALAIALFALWNVFLRPHSIAIVGTGDPLRDVRAIQAAVDRGYDTITLRGRFSFATPPTKPVDPRLASGWYPASAEIRVSRAITILGVRDEREEMATIESGTIPFYVDATAARVTIRGLRFVHPTEAAILVFAVRGLDITSNRIDGLVPLSNGAAGISINTRGEMPLPSNPGNPEDVSGSLQIAQNEIDATGGSAQAPTAGVNVFSVGQSPRREVDLDIVSNKIRNTTAPAINIRRVHGRVRVLGNTLETSPETIGDVDAVRLVNGGSILMANNTVECRWPNAAGIQIYSPFAEWPTDSVVVADNDVRMSPLAGAALGDFSAAISIRGFAHGDVVRQNRVSGRAAAALSMYAFRGGVPADNTFLDNRLDGFRATVADIVVGSGVARGHITGPGVLIDHGIATIHAPGTASRP
jgi:DNA-binding SARP family transcriptional activator